MARDGTNGTMIALSILKLYLILLLGSSPTIAFSNSPRATNRQLSPRHHRPSLRILLLHEKSGGGDNDLQPEQSGAEEYDLGVMLKQARSRKMVMLPYQIQAVFNKPSPIPKLTVGDAIFVVAALYLGAIGFAIGYSFGKLTVNELRQRTRYSGPVAAGLTELYTVGLAVVADVIWNNVV